MKNIVLISSLVFSLNVFADVDNSHISSTSYTTGINDNRVDAYGVQSNNIVNMSFPYKPHKGQLSLREYEEEDMGPEVILTVSGQITGKRVRVKIDNLPVFETGVRGKSDDSSTIAIGLIGSFVIGNTRSLPEKDWFAFMNDDEIKAFKYYKRKHREMGDKNWYAMMVVASRALERNLMNAKQLKIEVDLYNAPQKVYTFNASNLFSKVNYDSDLRKDTDAYMAKRPAK